ncbi:MAG: hypothetical protein ACE3JK_16750 [Sporolactobacillus sp.]
MILSGGIKINQQKVENVRLEVKIEDGMIIQIGKRHFLRIRC